LTAEQRQKLKVLRRISGGHVSDEELLRRLEQEMGAAGQPERKKKKKRGWFG